MSPIKCKMPCPGCGYEREVRSSSAFCHSCRKGTGELPEGSMEWMLTEARKMREEPPAADYATARARRHPWLSLEEAAHELDVSITRISQLISSGRFTHRKHPSRPREKQVAAANVYAYKTTPNRKNNRTA